MIIQLFLLFSVLRAATAMPSVQIDNETLSDSEPGCMGMPMLISHRNNTLDVQKFLQCLGGNSSTSISLYASTLPNNFILANSNSITDEEVGHWFRCLEEQEVDAELSLDTGVLRMDDEELVASSDTHDIFRWISTGFVMANANSLAKRADTGIQYSVFPNNN